nr:reverse transcriptase domain-containing protein [Tanacetum cinerariifolium]
MFHFPADFVVVDFEPDPRVPLILERCFLKTSRSLIDVHKGELTLRIGNEAITYNLDQTFRYSANYDQMTANKIDVTDEACEEYSQEVLGFLDVTVSGSPTPFYNLIVFTTSPAITLFGDSNFLLFEEADAFLGLEDDPDSPELDPSYYDSEGDILSLKEELKACEAKMIKSSIDEPLEDAKINTKARSLFNTLGSRSLRDYMTRMRIKGRAHKPPCVHQTVWDALWTIWESPEFIAKSDIGRAARQSNKRLHVAGSVSIAEHKRRLNLLGISFEPFWMDKSDCGACLSLGAFFAGLTMIVHMALKFAYCTEMALKVLYDGGPEEIGIKDLFSNEVSTMMSLRGSIVASFENFESFFAVHTPPDHLI